MVLAIKILEEIFHTFQMLIYEAVIELERLICSKNKDFLLLQLGKALALLSR